MPTGGVTLASAPSWHALDPVVSVGGSCLTPAAAVGTRDVATITALAASTIAALTAPNGRGCGASVLRR